MKKIVKSVLLGAFMATSAMVGAANADGEQFVWISHGPDSDSWFNVIKNAINITNPQSTERCRGFADGIGVGLGSQMSGLGIDPSEVQNKMQAYLTANPDTGAILTLGPNSAEPSIRAVKELGLDGDIYFGTFDLSAEIMAGIKDGTVNFAIDQQPFLQGSIPIQVLTAYVRYGVAPSNSIFTGPGFVTKDNIERVEALAGEFRRASARQGAGWGTSLSPPSRNGLHRGMQSMTDTTTAPRPDERIKKVSRWRRAMIHPELGGICGTVLTGLFFANAESSLFRVFLGMILLIAVIMNTYIRRITTGER